MTDLHFAIFGAGFWARFQLAAWQELKGARCVALCDSALSRAEKLAHEKGIPHFYSDPAELFRSEQIDFIDIVTPVETHAPLVFLAASHKIPVICQKPMASTLNEAKKMVIACQEAGNPLYIHENWRWQTPLRELKRVLEVGCIGRPFRARIDMISGFPVFVNQPFFKELEQFILMDLGSHLLDVARFLFGEAEKLYSQTHRVHADIKGEDAATVMLKMDEATVICEMAYAENYLEKDRFPETFVFIEGSKGSVELGPDYWIRVTTREGTHSRRYPPPRYDWADPAYDLVQSSIVACHANLLSALRGEGVAETTGEDNLKTVRLVFAAYDSARTGETISTSEYLSNDRSVG